MKKSKHSIEYDFMVHNISEDDIPAYKAYIPAFNAYCYGDTLAELEEGVEFMIETEIEDFKKAGKPIPPPDKAKEYSGKFVLRIAPALHERLTLEAKAFGESLNNFVEKKLMRTA